MNGNFMDADLRSVQQARDLAVAAREAMRAFQFAPQEEVDRICEAMVAAGMREAGRLGQLAHEETGPGDELRKRLDLTRFERRRADLRLLVEHLDAGLGVDADLRQRADQSAVTGRTDAGGHLLPGQLVERLHR